MHRVITTGQSNTHLQKYSNTKKRNILGSIRNKNYIGTVLNGYSVSQKVYETNLTPSELKRRVSRVCKTEASTSFALKRFHV